MTPWAGLLTSPAVLPALLAALAVSWWVVSPREQLARAKRPGVPAAPRDGGVSWWSPRPDAAPLGQRLVMSTVAAVAIGLALRSLYEPLGWAVVPVLATAGVVVLGRLEPRGEQQRRVRLVLDLPQALELMSACLASGLPLRTATAAVARSFTGPVAADLGLVLARVDLGVSDAEAWRALGGHPEWGAAAIDLARSVESGTMMVDALVHHAEQARRRRRTQLEVRAKSVGVRSVLPLMTCFLPAFLLLGVVPTVASAISNALF